MENWERAAAAAQQMAEKRGPYYQRWLIASRAEMISRLRELETEIIRLQEEEDDANQVS
jgi:hypothetical protein